jgi:hypothetical protein
MSTIVLFLYSKYIPQVKPYLDIIQKLDYVQTLCVDNEKIRQVILESSLLNIKKVPCFIVINKDNSVYQYTDVPVFLQKLIEANQPRQESVPQKIEKSPITKVIDTSQIIDEPLDMQSDNDIIQTNKSFPSHSRPISKEQDFERQERPDRKSSNRSNVGEIINYQKEKNEKLRPEQVTKTNINKGTGHDDMGRSSLRESSKKKEFDVIEDISEDESTEGLINFSAKSEEKKEKKISDIKSLVNEMSDAREEQLKKFNNKVAN